VTQSSIVADIVGAQGPRIMISDVEQARLDLRSSLGPAAERISDKELAAMARSRTVSQELRHLFPEPEQVGLLGLEPTAAQRARGVG
jgi:hypothetical protein